MAIEIVRCNTLLLITTRNKEERICQRPDLTDGEVMEFIAPCKGLGGRAKETELGK